MKLKLRFYEFIISALWLFNTKNNILTAAVESDVRIVRRYRIIIVQYFILQCCFSIFKNDPESKYILYYGDQGY